MTEMLHAFGISADAIQPQFQGAAPVVQIEDRICSAGKTSSMIQSLNPARQYLIVTPRLDDVQDIINRADVLLVQPEVRHRLRDNDNPHSIAHTKRGHLLELLQDGTNVVTTHALFDDLAWAARNNHLAGVDIIIDEIPDTSKPITSAAKQPPAGQVNILYWQNHYIRDGYADIDQETGQVQVTDKWRQDHVQGKNTLSPVIFEYADNGCLWAAGHTVLVWELPAVLLKSGRSCKIMTYLFNGSLLHGFMKKHGMQYEVNSDPKTREHYRAEEMRLREAARDLLTIKTIPGLESVKGFTVTRMDPKNLSTADQNKFVNALKRLRNSDLKGKQPGSVLVTCLKDLWFLDGKSEADVRQGQKPQQGPICKQGNKTTGLFNLCRWSASITRGTQAFSGCDTVLYLYDKRLHPGVAMTLGLSKDRAAEDRFAISEMIQFIYRSAIRQRDPDTGLPFIPTTVYVPSDRMRGLLLRWLDGDFSDVNDID